MSKFPQPASPQETHNIVVMIGIGVLLLPLLPMFIYFFVIFAMVGLLVFSPFIILTVILSAIYLCGKYVLEVLEFRKQYKEDVKNN